MKSPGRKVVTVSGAVTGLAILMVLLASIPARWQEEVTVGSSVLTDDEEMMICEEAMSSYEAGNRGGDLLLSWDRGRCFTHGYVPPWKPQYTTSVPESLVGIREIVSLSRLRKFLGEVSIEDTDWSAVRQDWLSMEIDDRSLASSAELAKARYVSILDRVRSYVNRHNHGNCYGTFLHLITSLESQVEYLDTLQAALGESDQIKRENLLDQASGSLEVQRINRVLADQQFEKMQSEWRC